MFQYLLRLLPVFTLLLILGVPIVVTLAWYHGARGQQRASGTEVMIIAILLALGRRSSLPVVRWVCITYIEFFRGVPLITILFLAFFMIGFILPEGVEPPSLVTRAIIGFTLFTCAYIAEIVRGGGGPRCMSLPLRRTPL